MPIEALESKDDWLRAFNAQTFPTCDYGLHERALPTCVAGGCCGTGVAPRVPDFSPFPGDASPIRRGPSSQH